MIMNLTKGQIELMRDAAYYMYRDKLLPSISVDLFAVLRQVDTSVYHLTYFVQIPDHCMLCLRIMLLHAFECTRCKGFDTLYDFIFGD